MRALRYVSLLAVACSSTPATRPTTSSAVDCNGLDTWACIEARRSSCRDDTRVWKVDHLMQGSVLYTEHVSEHGLVRRDTDGRTMYTVNSGDWLACVDGCAAGDGAACVPFAHDTRGKPLDGCKPTGKAAKVGSYDTDELTCVLSSGAHVEINVAPDLAELTRAEQRAGRTEHVSDSYPVKEGPGIERRVSKSDCSAFALPADIQRYTSPAHVRRSAELVPALRNAVDRVHAEERDRQPAGRVIDDVTRALGELCLGKRDTYEQAEVSTCLQGRPDIIERLPEITNRLAAQSGERFAAELAADTTERDYLSIPLCQSVAGETAADARPHATELKPVLGFAAGDRVVVTMEQKTTETQLGGDISGKRSVRARFRMNIDKVEDGVIRDMHVTFDQASSVFEAADGTTTTGGEELAGLELEVVGGRARPTDAMPASIRSAVEQGYELTPAVGADDLFAPQALYPGATMPAPLARRRMVSDHLTAYRSAAPDARLEHERGGLSIRVIELDATRAKLALTGSFRYALHGTIGEHRLGGFFEANVDDTLTVDIKMSRLLEHRARRTLKQGLELGSADKGGSTTEVDMVLRYQYLDPQTPVRSHAADIARYATLYQALFIALAAHGSDCDKVVAAIDAWRAEHRDELRPLSQRLQAAGRMKDAVDQASKNIDAGLALADVTRSCGGHEGFMKSFGAALRGQ